MTALNWILALVCLGLWGGAAVWFFRKMVLQAWAERNDKWRS